MFGVACPDINDNYEIVSWQLVSKAVDQATSTLLFRKYIDYIETFSTLKYVYCYQMPEIKELGFEDQGSLWRRKRKQ